MKSNHTRSLRLTDPDGYTWTQCRSLLVRGCIQVACPVGTTLTVTGRTIIKFTPTTVATTVMTVMILTIAVEPTSTRGIVTVLVMVGTMDLVDSVMMVMVVVIGVQ